MKKAVLLVTCSLLLTSMAPSALGAYAGSQDSTSVSAASSGSIIPQDKEGSVSFAALPERMLQNNLTIRNCQETLASYQAMDRQKAYDKLVNAINGLSDVVWGMSQSDKAGMMAGQIQQMQSQVDSMREQLDDLKVEEYEKTMDNVARKIENAIDQIIMGGETLYITAVTYAHQVVDLDRSLVSLSRTLEEMEARYQRGQISLLTLEQMRSTYSSTKSQAETLSVAITNMKTSLESLLGETPTGKIELEPLPAIPTKDLDSMSFDADLAAAKEVSYAIYSADKTLDDAKEDWDDARKTYGSASNYNYKMAEHTYQAAVFNHDAAIQSFQVSFDSLYRAVPDARQALAAAQNALAYQEQTYAASELKYQQGNISYNALLTEQDSVDAARSKVTSAELTLFSAWNTYQWAVEQGLLASSN